MASTPTVKRFNITRYKNQLHSEEFLKSSLNISGYKITIYNMNNYNLHPQALFRLTVLYHSKLLSSYFLTTNYLKLTEKERNNIRRSNIICSMTFNEELEYLSNLGYKILIKTYKKTTLLSQDILPLHDL